MTEKKSSTVPAQTRTVRKQDGTWQNGKASPKLLKENLRRLPSELVTEEIDEGDKIHELDPPHVVEDIKETWKEDQLSPKSESLQDSLKKIHLPPGYKLNPLAVDIIRMRIIRALIETALGKLKKNPAFDPGAYFSEHQYVWFLEDDYRKRELRQGNPPPDGDRPKHLRGYDLHINILEWPQRIVDILRENGATYTCPQDFITEIVKHANSAIIH